MSSVNLQSLSGNCSFTSHGNEDFSGIQHVLRCFIAWVHSRELPNSVGFKAMMAMNMSHFVSKACKSRCWKRQVLLVSLIPVMCVPIKMTWMHQSAEVALWEEQHNIKWKFVLSLWLKNSQQETNIVLLLLILRVNLLSAGTVSPGWIVSIVLHQTSP